MPREESRRDANAPRGEDRAFPSAVASWRLGGSLLFVLAACGGAPSRPAPAPPAQPIFAATVPSAAPAPSAEEAAPGRRGVALRFERGGRKFPLPVVHGTIAGRSAELLLDTGAHRTDRLTTSRPGRLLAAHARPSGEAMYAASGLVKARVVRGDPLRGRCGP